jgi:transcriptional regulator with XRE-family HTH domain
MTTSFDSAGFQKETGLMLTLRRKGAGMTQKTMAKKIGLERATYANIETGRQRVPLDVVWRAAVVLRISITKLVPEKLG